MYALGTPEKWLDRQRSKTKARQDSVGRGVERQVSRIFIFSLCVSACSSAASAPPVEVEPPPAAEAEPPPPPPPPCDAAPIPILAEETDGFLSRLYVGAELDGKRVAMLFDTGSPSTFLERPAGSPDPQKHVADLVLGGCKVAVDGRPYAVDESIDGLDAVGYLGANVLLDTPIAELDLAGKKIVRRATVDASWPTTKIDVVRDLILAHVVVDGQPLRLMVDTGSPHVLWVGRDGEPGDEEVHTTDAAGNDLTLYRGKADVALADGIASHVPILRAPSFPYFEQTVKSLGGDVQGLVGLSALGRRRIVVDRAAGVLRVEP
jgi:hypothetical protein